VLVGGAAGGQRACNACGTASWQPALTGPRQGQCQGRRWTGRHTALRPGEGLQCRRTGRRRRRFVRAMAKPGNLSAVTAREIIPALFQADRLAPHSVANRGHSP
jgi:hypothetical protein